MRWTIATVFVLAILLASCSTENLQGDAGKPGVCGKPTHRYESFNPDDRTVEFTDVASGATIAVSVDAAGKGEMVWKGVHYSIQVDDVTAAEPLVFIDPNRDGWLDKRLRIDDYFVIPSCY